MSIIDVGRVAGGIGIGFGLVAVAPPAQAAEELIMAAAGAARATARQVTSAPGPDPTVATLLPIGCFPLGLAIGAGLPLWLGGGSQGPLAFAGGATLGTLGLVSGHLYAGDPGRGFTQAAWGVPAALGVGLIGLGLGSLIPPSGTGSFPGLQGFGYGLYAGVLGWAAYMAWDAGQVAAEVSDGRRLP